MAMSNLDALLIGPPPLGQSAETTIITATHCPLFLALSFP
jgi:hypothetical protein